MPQESNITMNLVHFFTPRKQTRDIKILEHAFYDIVGDF